MEYEKRAGYAHLWQMVEIVKVVCHKEKHIFMGRKMKYRMACNVDKDTPLQKEYFVGCEVACF